MQLIAEYDPNPNAADRYKLRIYKPELTHNSGIIRFGHSNLIASLCEQTAYANQSMIMPGFSQEFPETSLIFEGLNIHADTESRYAFDYFATVLPAAPTNMTASLIEEFSHSPITTLLLIYGQTPSQFQNDLLRNAQPFMMIRRNHDGSTISRCNGFRRESRNRHLAVRHYDGNSSAKDYEFNERSLIPMDLQALLSKIDFRQWLQIRSHYQFMLKILGSAVNDASQSNIITL